ncbi:MAG: hypothetical protein QF473_01115 [Planctomycetota bacterium]|nr:hypothetical protein [Planctomycetota bacterium]
MKRIIDLLLLLERDEGPEPGDLFESVSGKFVGKDVSQTATLPMGGNAAASIVVAPSDGKVTHQGSKTLINGVVVDFHSPVTD